MVIKFSMYFVTLVSFNQCFSSYVLEILEKEKKFIIFAHHQVMLNAIEKLLVKSNKDYIRIDGNISADNRKRLVDKFQQDDRCECALLSITAANAGITLTAAKLVLFAELHWNPSVSNFTLFLTNLNQSIRFRY